MPWRTDIVVEFGAPRHQDIIERYVKGGASRGRNVRVFSIFAYRSDDFIAVQPEVESWTMPALAVVDGSVFGIEPFATFVLKDTRMWVPDANGGHPEQVPADPARSGLTQDQFNAVLLLGPADSMVTSEPRGLSSQN